MSADNEIAILEMTDKDGHKTYLVADNVSMSYNLLRPRIDLTKNWQAAMVHNIWKDAKEFYHSADAHEYANKLEENGYYEYGCASFKVKADWEEIVRIKEENKCLTCDGRGYFEKQAYPEIPDSDVMCHDNCEACSGMGLNKPWDNIEMEES